MPRIVTSRMMPTTWLGWPGTETETSPSAAPAGVVGSVGACGPASGTAGRDRRRGDLHRGVGAARGRRGGRCRAARDEARRAEEQRGGREARPRLTRRLTPAAPSRRAARRSPAARCAATAPSPTPAAAAGRRPRPRRHVGPARQRPARRPPGRPPGPRWPGSPSSPAVRPAARSAEARSGWPVMSTPAGIARSRRDGRPGAAGVAAGGGPVAGGLAGWSGRLEDDVHRLLARRHVERA